MSTKFDYILSERSELAALQPANYKAVLEIGCTNGGLKIAS